MKKFLFVVIVFVVGYILGNIIPIKATTKFLKNTGKNIEKAAGDISEQAKNYADSI